MKKISERKRFSLVARIKSTNNAWRGVLIFIRSTHNAWLHLFFGVMAIYLGFILNITNIEWAILVLTIGLVIFAEIINTSIEIDIDLTSPDYHPYARDTKDVAAGAVLISAFIACVVGLIIFLPKILLIIE